MADRHEARDIVAEILAATKTRDHRVFAGKIDRKNLSFPERAMLMAFPRDEGSLRTAVTVIVLPPSEIR